MHSRIEFALTQAGVEHRERRHADLSIPIRSPQDFALALDFEISRIAKTLLLCTPGKDGFCLVVLSCDKRLNMKLVAAVRGVGRLQLAGKDVLANALDYPPTGVSPIGAATIPVLMDDELLRFETIMIGAGEVGAELEISPRDLQLITKAKLIRLSE